MSNTENKAGRITLLVTVIILVMAVVFFIPPVPQSPHYHDFADQRTFAGIPHFWNVITNIPFLIIGLTALLYSKSAIGPKSLRVSYRVFFIGIMLTGCGSIYYHLQPSTTTLVWDRLPMTIAFMAFLALIIADTFSVPSTYLLWPLILTGIGSVLHWHYTEQAGVGDLRLYGLVQFLPLLLIPMIFVMFQPGHIQTNYLALILGVYLIAKVFEFFDAGFYELTGMISGHSMKHLIAALAPAFLFLGSRPRV